MVVDVNLLGDIRDKASRTPLKNQYGQLAIMVKDLANQLLELNKEILSIKSKIK